MEDSATGSAEPWMRINDNYQNLNVAREEADPGSIFHFWKELIKLRNQNKDTWVYGDYELLDTEDVIFAFVKSGGGKKFTTVANMSRDSGSMDNEIEALHEQHGRQHKLRYFATMGGKGICR